MMSFSRLCTMHTKIGNLGVFAIAMLTIMATPASAERSNSVENWFFAERHGFCAAYAAQGTRDASLVHLLNFEAFGEAALESPRILAHEATNSELASRFDRRQAELRAFPNISFFLGYLASGRSDRIRHIIFDELGPDHPSGFALLEAMQQSADSKYLSGGCADLPKLVEISESMVVE